MYAEKGEIISLTEINEVTNPSNELKTKEDLKNFGNQTHPDTTSPINSNYASKLAIKESQKRPLGAKLKDKRGSSVASRERSMASREREKRNRTQ